MGPSGPARFGPGFQPGSGRPRPQFQNTFSHVPAKMEPYHPATGLKQGPSVSRGLRGFENAEADRRPIRPWFVGDRKVGRVIRGELHEQAPTRVAFVQLSRGVKEPGSVPDRGRQPVLVAQLKPQRV